MKLISRIALRLSLALLPLMALWGVLFYFTMVDEINDEADDALEDYSELIVKRMLAGRELPEKAQQFIRQHFPNEKVSFAKMERELFDTTYEVIFTSSSKVEFLKNGDWKEVDCKYSTVPAAIIPQQIAQYVSQYYPDTSVVQIDRDKRDYEVKLTNGLELTFDLKFNLIDIDD